MDDSLGMWRLEMGKMENEIMNEHE